VVPGNNASDMERKKKFAVTIPVIEISLKPEIGFNNIISHQRLCDLKFFSGMNAALSGSTRSLDFLLLFDQAKSKLIYIRDCIPEKLHLTLIKNFTRSFIRRKIEIPRDAIPFPKYSTIIYRWVLLKKWRGH
jgi:hypothetical protein